MMLVACISFLFAFFIEGSIVIWEKRVGFPLYNCVFQFRGFRVSVIINFFLLFATCWIMAGARGLFAYGPLNAGYT
ncbi:hypothetical protein BC829DRAFT_408257 [Chytridium lagenaria]|nr:hypothetical protein BC829DRAFT_408257 [Chytridium lagenaria]